MVIEHKRKNNRKAPEFFRGLVEVFLVLLNEIKVREITSICAFTSLIFLCSLLHEIYSTSIIAHDQFSFKFLNMIWP